MKNEYIKLYNGYSIPCIGYGTFPQKEQLVENIVLACKTGYLLVDSSDNYHNEKFIGDALNNIESNQIPFIITKCSKPLNAYNITELFQESKKKLNGNLDIYLLHWPYPFLWKIMWKQMEGLYIEGKCSAIGVCNFEEKHLKKLMKICEVKPMINQIEIHPDFQQKSTVNYCEKNNIKIMSYSPLARIDNLLYSNEAINQIAKDKNKSVSQVILKWNIQKGFIPIPGSSSFNHLKENFDINDFNLTKNEMQIIDSQDSNNRVRYDPDKRFTIKQKIQFLKLSLKIKKSRTSS